MSINLLPSEEKIKTGKIKYQPTPIVEMTGPVKLEKSKPAIKRGGVLGFFKQAFAKPKPVVADAEKQWPEKKVMVEEKLVYEKPKPQPAPRPIIKMVAPEQERMQVRSSKPFGVRMSNFFSSMFGGKPKALVPAPSVPPVTAKDAFPKYQPIRAEKIPAVEPVRKPKPTEVITVTTNGRKPDNGVTMPEVTTNGRRFDIPHEGFPKIDPAFKVIKQTSIPALQPKAPKVSFWKKIANWFKKFFVRAPKQKIISMTPVEPEKLIKTPEPPIVARVEQKVAAPSAPTFIPQPMLHRDSAVPHKIMPPFTRPEPNINKILETPKQTVKEFIPPMPVKPVQSQSVVTPIISTPKPPPPPSIKTAPPIVPPPPPAEKASEVKVDQVSWWEKLWKAIKDLFSGKKISSKKSSLKQIGSVQNIPGVKLTDVKGAGKMLSPIEWEVNLVPEEIIEKALPISKILVGILSIIIAVGIVFGGWVVANYYYSNVSAKVSGLNGQIASNRIEINSYQQLQEEVRNLNQVMGNIDTLIKKHVYWSGIFNKLENYTVSGVYFTSLTADVNGSVSLAAIGQDYESAIKQFEVFKRATDFVTKVTVTGICFTEDTNCLGAGSGSLLIAQTQDTVKFSVNLMITPTIFYWPQ